MKKCAIICVFSALLSACNLVGGHKVPPRPQITEAMVQAGIGDREFGKALDALNAKKQADPNSTRFAELRLQLEADISAYEQDLIHRVVTLIDQGQWAEALAGVDRGFAKVPNSAVLNQHLSKIRERQHFKVDMVKNNLLIFTGEHMARLLPALETIVTIMPRDKAAKSRLDTARKEADELAAGIIELGLKAVSSGDEKRGANLLKLATTLTLNPVVLNAYRDFQSIQANIELQKRNKRKKPKSEQKRRAEAQELEDASENFEAFFKAKRYDDAKNTLDQIRKNPEHRKLIVPLEKKLQMAIAEHVKSLYQKGADYYSRENYELALERWLAVLQLQPEHEKAKEYTERTKRILARLNQLREKQHASE